MYGAKTSTKLPAGFGVQKVQPIKKANKEKNSKLDIINIFVLLVLIILSGIGIATSYYNEDVFATTLFTGIITLILKIALAVVQSRTLI